MDSIDYYNRYAVPYYESTIDLDMSEIMQPFLDELPENAEVLDLGCGSGRDSLTLEEQGCLVTALDGSEEMCKLAEIYIDKPVLCMTYDEMDFDQVFDGIWACASLVHLAPEEMKRILEKLRQALKNDGVLYFSVHQGDRRGTYNGRYFCDYTRQELRDLLEEVGGYRIIDIWKTSDVRSGRDDRIWLNVLVRKLPEE